MTLFLAQLLVSWPAILFSLLVSIIGIVSGAGFLLAIGALSSVQKETK